MQPTNEQPQQHGSPFDTGTWTGSSASAPPTVTVKRARPWLVALVALVTLFVLIAGLGNQWVTDRIAKHATGDTFADHAVRSDATYAWRFSPRGNSDFGHFWLASICLVLAALVLTFLLVAAVCRGKGGFGQVFLGTWAAVLAATVLAGYVRAAIIDTDQYVGRHYSKANAIFFSPVSPGAGLIAAALGFGFVVAIVAGLTALLSRRKEELIAPAAVSADYGPPPGAEADAPRPWNAPPAVPGPVATPSAWTGDDETNRTGPPETTENATADPTPQPPQTHHTAVLPPVDEPRPDERRPAESSSADSESADSGREHAGPEEEATTQLPRSGWSEDAQHTTQLPRSQPSDEDPESPRHLSE